VPYGKCKHKWKPRWGKFGDCLPMVKEEECMEEKAVKAPPIETAPVEAGPADPATTEDVVPTEAPVEEAPAGATAETTDTAPEGAASAAED